jgi:HSP20 family molecular chaperone IbpA
MALNRNNADTEERPHYRPYALARYPHHLFSLGDHLFDAFDSTYEIPTHWLQEITGERPAAGAGVRSTEITDNDQVFRIDLPVQGYTPDELNVKLVRDRFLVIEGAKKQRKEQEGDKGFVIAVSTQKFQRSFVVPQGVDVQKLRSSFGQDGTLCIEAPKVLRPEQMPGERNIQIEHGGYLGLENGPM